MWYDLGATHGCLYEMRNRLAMGHSALPLTVSPATCATSSAPSTQPHPRVGQKAVKMPCRHRLPAASTTDQPTDTSAQSSSAKIERISVRRRRKKLLLPTHRSLRSPRKGQPRMPTPTPRLTRFKWSQRRKPPPRPRAPQQNDPESPHPRRYHPQSPQTPRQKDLSPIVATQRELRVPLNPRGVSSSRR